MFSEAYRLLAQERSLAGDTELLTAVEMMLDKAAKFTDKELSIERLNEFYDGELTPVQITKILNHLTHLQTGTALFLLKVLDETDFTVDGTVHGANGDDYDYDMSSIDLDT